MLRFPFADTRCVLHDSTSVDQALAHHRAGRLDEAAALYRQLLVSEPDHALVLNLLGNVEYQTDHFDEARRLIERAIRIDPASHVFQITLGHVHRRLGDLGSAIVCYRQALHLRADSSLASMHLAETLKAHGDPFASIHALQALLSHEPNHQTALRLLGGLCLDVEQPLAAVAVYRHLVDLDPGSADAAFGLGVACSRQGLQQDAIASFERALALRPEFPEAMFDLGVIAFEQQQLAVAEAWFRRAVEARPGYVDAHVNLSAVLLRTGRADEARVHRDLAYRSRCLFVRTSPVAERSVLILFDAARGNINLSHLLSRTRNTVIDWMIEYASPRQGDALPPFDIVFNAMGDPDMVGAGAVPAAQFIAACGKPVLNRPDAVARTSREKIPGLLADIEGLVVPKVWRLAADAPWPAEIEPTQPVLVRPVDSHGGEGLRLTTAADALAHTASHASTTARYVCAFHDFRSPDGFHRKYRVVFIDRQPFPYHLAISPHWLVHYATADMPGHAWKLDEERRFLDAPSAALGVRAWAAITAIGARMDLDYAGVDFSVLDDGRVLVFEANPVMLVHPEDEGGVLAFKNASVERILEAFEALLSRLTGRNA